MEFRYYFVVKTFAANVEQRVSQVRQTFVHFDANPMAIARRLILEPVNAVAINRADEHALA